MLTRTSATALGAAALGAVAVVVAAPLSARAQTFTILHNFAGGTDGEQPVGHLIYHGGTLYGTTLGGGPAEAGTVFAVNASTGVETVLYAFTGGLDGGTLVAGLAYQGGALYGTTYLGGTAGKGVAFRVDSATGVEKVLHDFGSGNDGAEPESQLISQGGSLYGTTVVGGGGGCGFGCGTVFKLDLAGHAETILYSFTGKPDGSDPTGNLVYQGGLLYGTTYAGGASNCGAVFKIDPATGSETVLYSFAGGNDGCEAASGLTYDAGALYGATNYGGGTGCRGEGCGTVFKFDIATGTETVLRNFGVGRHPQYPQGGLVSRGGALVGVTSSGGRGKLGSIYKVNANSGATKLLYSLLGGAGGANPAGGVIYIGGAFYGVTSGGGQYCGQDYCYGTVFKFVP